ncbi:TonB-dependent copper receptor [Shewanella surugensis]|uniref:TonB-dependent copper receptor n=1 Tax=Shewanella surugensis TaxID=212020 RepID=A0ABT0LDM1_9GAMM|nr:TonB-dependent copper receptor [Shewanella surugensis]MCL1125809.1 TonB-dependent copper receptor [Shewanella surugensis]
MTFQQPPSCTAIILVFSLSPFGLVFANAQNKNNNDITFDEHMIITSDRMLEPIKVSTDPKKPRLPLPAYDGAGYLKTIPGFNVGRKGGAGGDPSLRGMGGSRLSIVDDSQHVYGTCGGRMDPPTAYIYPEAYSSITVIKGPQTVKYGPVGSAGTVLFEKERHAFTDTDIEGRASTTVGSFSRRDYVAALKAGSSQGYLNLDANQSHSGDYKDGRGNRVQSSYNRNNANVALGWTPTQDSVIELAYGHSNGEAQYADRANQAREIKNENISLLTQFDVDLQLLKRIELQAYSNHNNHIMDQFDQGVNAGANVRRSTAGGHIWFELSPSSDIELTLGLDYMQSQHKGRYIDKTQDQGLSDLLAKPFRDNLHYNNSAMLSELTYSLSTGKVVSGLRFDHWNTELFIGQTGQRTDDLTSGYLRYELPIQQALYYIGIGHAQRVPDYWEIMKASPDDLNHKAFNLKPEKNTQIDIGWIYQGEIGISTSLFYSHVEDYILINTNTEKTTAYNIDASVWGGELDMSYLFTPHWSTQSSISYSHGRNDTEHTALGQISPLEAKFSLNYQYQAWTAGALWRVVASQNRIALGEGNIAGQDLSQSHAFNTLALNMSWQHDLGILVSLGIENLLNSTYAEHISRSGAKNDAPESEPMFQVNEPGRTAWIKIDYTF